MTLPIQQDQDEGPTIVHHRDGLTETMGFKIEIDDDSANDRIPIAPPPDYTSRTTKIRLMMLFGLLILVLVLMKEAGDPENWKWMGFEDEVAERNGDLEIKNPVSPAADVRTAPPSELKPPPAGESTESSDETLTSPGAVETGRALRTTGDPWQRPSTSSSTPNSNTYPEKAVEFWTYVVGKMSSRQHETLYRMLRHFRSPALMQGLEIDSAEHEKLVQIIVSRRDQFHREQFDQLALLADGSEQKTRLAEELFDAQEIWDNKILPAFRAQLDGEDITVSQLQALNRLQEVLDPLVFSTVQDRSSIGWEGDSPTWLRLWERILSRDLDIPEPATHLQLSSQPDVYRGRTVEIEGWVRSAKRVELINNELGLTHYFVMWMRPADTNVAPFNVYTLEVPESFPELTTEFQELNQHVRLSGLFFKIRSFVDTEKQVRESPIVLTDHLTPIEAIVPTDVNRWQPSRTTLVVLLVLIPVVAVAVAWGVYRGTETRPYRPGESKTAGINLTLNDLKNDPDVKSDSEKIRELYQLDEDQG